MTSERDRALDPQDSVRIVAPCCSPQRTRVSPRARRPIPGAQKWRRRVCTLEKDSLPLLPSLLLRKPEHISLMHVTARRLPKAPKQSSETLSRTGCMHQTPALPLAPPASPSRPAWCQECSGALQPLLPFPSAHPERGSSQPMCPRGGRVRVSFLDLKKPLPSAMLSFFCVPT